MLTDDTPGIEVPQDDCKTLAGLTRQAQLQPPAIRRQIGRDWQAEADLCVSSRSVEIRTRAMALAAGACALPGLDQYAIGMIAHHAHRVAPPAALNAILAATVTFRRPENFLFRTMYGSKLATQWKRCIGIAGRKANRRNGIEHLADSIVVLQQGLGSPLLARPTIDPLIQLGPRMAHSGLTIMTLSQGLQVRAISNDQVTALASLWTWHAAKMSPVEFAQIAELGRQGKLSPRLAHAVGEMANPRTFRDRYAVLPGFLLHEAPGRQQSRLAFDRARAKRGEAASPL